MTALTNAINEALNSIFASDLTTIVRIHSFGLYEI